MTTSFTRDRGYTRARFGRDEEGIEELREMLNDQDASPAEMLAALIECAPESQREGLYQALSELASDRRGPRSWAQDRLEMRRLGRDMRDRRAKDRRLGRDFAEENLTAGGRSGPIEGFGNGQFCVVGGSDGWDDAVGGALERGDVDALHLHHRVEGPSCACPIGIAD
jgi:hypothetical protein